MMGGVVGEVLHKLELAVHMLEQEGVRRRLEQAEELHTLEQVEELHMLEQGDERRMLGHEDVPHMLGQAVELHMTVKEQVPVEGCRLEELAELDVEYRPVGPLQELLRVQQLGQSELWLGDQGHTRQGGLRGRVRLGNQCRPGTNTIKHFLPQFIMPLITATFLTLTIYT